jgi:hypothetical protein
MAISPAPVEAQGITSQRDKYGNLVRNNGLATPNAPRPMTNSARPAPTPQFSVVKTPRGTVVIRQH